MCSSIAKFVEGDLADDQLAKWAGHPTLDSFREAIKAEIYVQKLRDRKRDIDSQISSHLLKNVKMDLPKREVERQHKELMDRVIYNLRSRGIPEDDIDKYKKEVQDKLKPIAEDEVKLFHILI